MGQSAAESATSAPMGMTMKDKRTRAEMTADQELAFDLIKKGLSYRDIGRIMGISADQVGHTLHRYEPFKQMRAEEAKVRSELAEANRKKVIEMTKEGKTTSNIAETLHMSYKKVRDIRIAEGLQQPKEHKQYEFLTRDEPIFKVTIDDVEVFKKVIQVGDVLQINLEGGKGRVTGKHTHYADIAGMTIEDSYGIPWNWLCVCNREVIGR